MEKDLFSRLSNLKNIRSLSELSLQNEFPSCVRELSLKLEIEAGKYRKINPGIKAKIDFENCLPIIMIKDPKTDSRYKKLET